MKIIQKKTTTAGPAGVKTTLGLGDLTKKALAPIAKTLGLENCGGCAQRAEKLNALIPDVQHPFKRS